MGSSSIEQERKNFLKKLKTNPFFLSKHAISLGKIFLQRKRAMRNRRELPRGLPKTLMQIQLADDVWQNMPVREFSQDKKIKVIESKFSTSLSNFFVTGTFVYDKETYLAKHRFAELTQELVEFNSAPHLQQSLPKAIQQWIEKPPAKTDLAWETYSTCERVANLLTWISFKSVAEREKLPNAIRQFLKESMHWIYQNLEYYDKNTNNHIINNARALIMCGKALGHKQAVQCGVQILKQLLPVLIQEEGSLRERSTHYQLVVLNWLLDALTFAPHEMVEMQRIILLARDVAAAFCDSQGNLQAFIGDISPDATPQMSCARLRLCYPEYWPIKNTFLQQGTQRFDDYYVMNYKQHKIIMNWPQGKFPCKHPTHGHNDLTSFVWDYAAQPILIDSGRSRYTKDSVSLQQKSARAHNLALVDHYAPLSESLVLVGSWWPEPYAETIINIDHEVMAQTIAIKHHGFKRATKVKMHKRCIKVSDACLYIQDEFYGEGEVNIELIFHWHQAFAPQDPYTFASDKWQVRLLCEQFNQLSNEKACHSFAYGHGEEHYFTTLNFRAKLPFITKVSFDIREMLSNSRGI